MEFGLIKPYVVWFLGPDSIMALELDPLGVEKRVFSDGLETRIPAQRQENNFYETLQCTSIPF